MFLTISVWWFIGDILQINRRSETLRAKYNLSSRREKAIQPIPARVVSMPGSDALKNSTGATVKGHLISNRNLGGGSPLPLQQPGKVVWRAGGRIHHSQEPAQLRKRTDVPFLWLGRNRGSRNVLSPSPSSAKFDYLVMSLAFSVEGFLFYVHLHGDDKFKVNRTLFILDFGTTIVFLLLAVESHRFASVADPDLPIRGGGGGGHPDLEITGEGQSPKIFFPPFGPLSGLKMGGGAVRTPRASPLDPPLCLLCELFESLFTELAGRLVFAHWFHSLWHLGKCGALGICFSFTYTDYIFILHASMWLHYMFSLFCQKEPTERTPLGNYSEDEEEND